MWPPYHRAEGKRKRRKNKSESATKLLIRERKRTKQQKSLRESSMVSRDNNQHSISPVLHEKLQLLRSITHSTSVFLSRSLLLVLDECSGTNSTKSLISPVLLKDG